MARQAAHIWFSETGIPWGGGSGESPLLGIHEGKAFALLYNGVLGDKRPAGGNVLTRGTLALIREALAGVAQGFDGPLTVYGEQSRLAPATLERERIALTPRPHSNILHSVTASELKAEEMVKLPVMLSEYDTWQNAVNGAVATRVSLAETAAGDTGPIRPIVLFQAQKKNGEVTAAVLKQHLIDVERIPEDRIAVAEK